MKLTIRRSAIASATAIVAIGASLVAGGASAHAASPDGYFSYESGNGWCTAGMLFEREASHQNRAEGVVEVGVAPTSDECVGALYRSANGGGWVQVSAVHTVWGTGEYASASWTDWYGDGLNYLVRMCVHPVYGHSSSSGPTTCTSAH